MRSLKTSDLFAFARCIKEIDLKEEIKKIAMETDNVQDIAANGFDYLYLLFEKAAEKKSEQAIYKFLSGPFEISPEKVAEMDLFEWIENLKQIAEPEKWKVFFRQAARLTQ